MFMAGILPGILCAVSLMVAIWIVSVKRGYQPMLQSWPKPKEFGKATINAWPALLVLVGVVGGIRANIFTPTEAGAAGVLIVTLIGFLVYKQMRLEHVTAALVSTAKATASIMLVIMASSALAWIFSLEHDGVAMSECISRLTCNTYIFIADLTI